MFSRDVTRAFAVARRIDTGICHINGPTVHDEAQMPFGGVKDSGYGRFGGKAAIDEFTELRWITIQSGHRHYPFWKLCTFSAVDCRVPPAGAMAGLALTLISMSFQVRPSMAKTRWKLTRDGVVA